MREQYMWSAGTPVLMLGLKYDYPSEDALRHKWVTAAAGRLAETFRPGASVIMRQGPMAASVPAKGWSTAGLFRINRNLAHVSNREYANLMHSGWKNVFLLRADEGAPDHLGCRGFLLVRDGAEVPRRIGAGTTALVDRIEAMREPSTTSLISVVPEIISTFDWFLGGFYSWAAVAIDDRGEPMRRCTDPACGKEHSLRA